MGMQDLNESTCLPCELLSCNEACDVKVHRQTEVVGGGITAGRKEKKKEKKQPRT